MYLSTAKFKDKPFIGCKVGEYLIHLDKAYKHYVGKVSQPWLQDMRSLLAQCDTGMEKIKELKDKIQNIVVAHGECEALLSRDIIHSLEDVQLMAPILHPDKIICIGLNYKDHCLEQNVPIPESPILFSKFSTAIIGPEDKIVRPKLTEQLDFEGELAFIVGKEGRHISIGQAMNYVAGYTILNDVSARDIQFSDRQWLRGKTFDTFAPMGPFLVTKDEVEDPHNLTIKLKLNDKVMQHSNTKNMIHKIPFLVNFISKVVTLTPGDVVATGTPSGVGVFRKPPVFLNDGDKIIVEIEGLGILRNTVVGEKG